MDDQVVRTDSNFSERVPQPFERIDNFSERMDDFCERMTKPLERMQIFPNGYTSRSNGWAIFVNG